MSPCEPKGDFPLNQKDMQTLKEPSCTQVRCLKRKYYHVIMVTNTFRSFCHLQQLAFFNAYSVANTTWGKETIKRKQWIILTSRAHNLGDSAIIQVGLTGVNKKSTNSDRIMAKEEGWLETGACFLKDMTFDLNFDKGMGFDRWKWRKNILPKANDYQVLVVSPWHAHMHTHTGYPYSECPFAHTCTHSTRFLWARPRDCSLAIRTTGHMSQNGKIETHVSVEYNLNHMLLLYFCLVHQNCLSHVSLDSKKPSKIFFFSSFDM